MDRLNRYREILRQVIAERAELMRSQPVPGEQVVCLTDESQNHFLLLRYGWVRDRYLHSVTIHARLTGDSVSIEVDWTDDFVAELIERGIPRERIVFGFAPPYARSQAA